MKHVADNSRTYRMVSVLMLAYLPRYIDLNADSTDFAAVSADSRDLMKTDEVARQLNVVPSYVTQLIREKKLEGVKHGRRYEVTLEAIEQYKAEYWGTKAMAGAAKTAETNEPISTEQTTHLGAPASDERTKAGTVGADSDLVNVIRELEQDSIVVFAESISLAQLFSALDKTFLEGIDPVMLRSSVMRALPEGNEEERARAGDEAVGRLMFALRTLRLVHDVSRQYGEWGKTVVVTTDLGASVIRALRTREWPRPQP